MKRTKKITSIVLVGLTLAVIVLGGACGSSRVEKLEAEVKNQEEEVATLKKMIENKKQEIDDRDQAIKERNATIEGDRKKIGDLEKELTKARSTVTSLTQQLENCDCE